MRGARWVAAKRGHQGLTMLHACVMVYTGGVNMARVNVTMPDKVWVRASLVASELGLSMSAFCVLAVSEYIKQRREIYLENKGVSKVDV